MWDAQWPSSLVGHILTLNVKESLLCLRVFVIPPMSLSKCLQYREQASVLENQPTGTFVLQVHAVDADEGANGKVKYGLMHRDSATPAFRIYPNTGTGLLGGNLASLMHRALNALHTDNVVIILILKGSLQI